MTEQPDTAELRALITKNGPPLSPMLIFTLLDALDAACARLDDVTLANLYDEAQDEITDLHARAEATEANLAFAQERAANNHTRAVIGEEKIAELVAEIRGLRDQTQ